MKFNGICLINNDSDPSLGAVNLYISSTLDSRSRDLNTDFTLGKCLFGTVKLTRNSDPDKYKYSSYGIGFDSHSQFSFTDGSMGKNVIMFGTDMSLSVYVDNKRKCILILGEALTQGLDYTTLTAESKYRISFIQSNRRYGSDSFLFVDATRRYQFKAKGSEIKKYPLCLDNVSKGFTKTELKGSVKFFSFDYRSINTNENSDIHKYLMLRSYKIMFGIIKKMFIVLLASIVNDSGHECL